MLSKLPDVSKLISWFILIGMIFSLIGGAVAGGYKIYATATQTLTLVENSAKKFDRMRKDIREISVQVEGISRDYVGIAFLDEGFIHFRLPAQYNNQIIKIRYEELVSSFATKGGFNVTQTK